MIPWVISSDTRVQLWATESGPKAKKDKRQIFLSLGSDALKYLVQRLTSPDLEQSSAGKSLIFPVHLLFSLLHGHLLDQK